MSTYRREEAPESTGKQKVCCVCGNQVKKKKRVKLRDGYLCRHCIKKIPMLYLLSLPDDDNLKKMSVRDVMEQVLIEREEHDKLNALQKAQEQYLKERCSHGQISTSLFPYTKVHFDSIEFKSDIEFPKVHNVLCLSDNGLVFGSDKDRRPIELGHEAIRNMERTTIKRMSSKREHFLDGSSNYREGYLEIESEVLKIQFDGPGHDDAIIIEKVLRKRHQYDDGQWPDKSKWMDCGIDSGSRLNPDETPLQIIRGIWKRNWRGSNQKPFVVGPSDKR